MALVLIDRAKETTNTTGTGTLTLAGAVSGFQSLAGVGDGNTTFYTIESGTDWEVGVGTYTSSGTTLSRDLVLSSSSGGSKITVASGAYVWVDYPAGRAVTTDNAVTLTNKTLVAPALGTPSSGNLANCTFPTLNQNTTGTAANVSGTVAIANGGTGATTSTAAITNLGATTVGSNLFTLPNPSAERFIRINTDNTITARTASGFRLDLGATTLGSNLFTIPNTPGTILFPRFNIDSSVSSLNAADFRTAIGAGTGNGTVTSITAGTGLSGGTITSSGTIAIDSTVATLSGTQTLTNKTLTSPTMIGTLIEDVFTITDGAGFAIDPNNGSIQLVTLGADRTPTVANFDAGEAVTMMIDDGTARTITWTTIGVVWVGGTAPTLATSGYTVIELWRVGSTYYGALVGNVA